MAEGKTAEIPPQKGQVDFTKWTDTYKLGPEIVSRLAAEDLDDMETLKEFRVEEVKSLKLKPEEATLLSSALESLSVENDNSDLGIWANQNRIDMETVVQLRSGGIGNLEQLRRATEDDIKNVNIKAGQRIRIKKGMDELNDTDFLRYLKEKGIKEETTKKLIQQDFDSKETIVLMEKKHIEDLQVLPAQQLLLSSIIQELKEEEPEKYQIRYGDAFEQFLKEINLDEATICELKKFGMDSPEALMILNKDIGLLSLPRDQRSLLDDAIESLKKFNEGPDMEKAIADVLQSKRSSRGPFLPLNIWTGVIGAYLAFIANTEGVTKTAFANMASYMKSVGAKGEPDKIMMKNGMRIVKLSIKQIYEDKDGKIRKCIIGNERPGQHQKTILLVGATGAGKSSLINGLCNYIFDSKWEERNRFKLIDEHKDEILNAEKGQTMSQTEWITIYTISSGESNRLPYTLNVIDTPGFGDVRGISRDQKLVEQIRSLFKNKDEHGVDSIDGVCFVAKAPDVRLTPTQSYVFSSIMKVFGKDIEKNILVLITFGDGAEPPVLEAIKAAKLPYTAEFKFNNSALFENNGFTDLPLSLTCSSTAKTNDMSTEFGKMFWDMGMQSFDTFFKFLKTLIPKSLYLTNEVLEQRRILKDILAYLEDKIRINLSTMDNLTQEEKILRETENRIRDDRNLKRTVSRRYAEKIPCKPWVSVTQCMVCQETCHNNCTIKEDENKYKCDVINKGTGKCMSCKRKCDWTDHKNTGYTLKLKTRIMPVSWKSRLQEFDRAAGIAAEKKDVITGIKADYAASEDEVRDYVKRCHDILTVLSRIAMKPYSFTEVDFIDELIMTETEEHKEGWLYRVQQLKQFKREAETLTTVANQK